MNTRSVKEQYRSDILRISQYVKISVICKEVGISYSAMNKFLNHDRDELISLNKLQSFMSFLSTAIN